MSKWLEGRVVGQKHWTDRLLSLQVAVPLGPFQAGQFVKLALDVGAERVARPYSFVNPPGSEPHEFYYNIVAEGPLSPRLAALRPGDTVQVATGIAGFLVLSEVPDAENLWLVATGTGLAPFLSILRTETPWERFRRVVLVHATRTADEQVYAELLAAIGAERGERFRKVAFVSRERAPGALAGRIPAAIGDGRLERAAGTELSAARSHAMLCGNPQMVTDVTAALGARGMRKHRRRAPGHITVETYW
jgi:ferredoxin--NADP+ reductase